MVSQRVTPAEPLPGGCRGGLNEPELWGCAAPRRKPRARNSFKAMARAKIHVAFEIGVILKGLNGLLELISGILLLVFPPSAIQRFVVGLTHNELSRDPNDFIATHLRAAAEHLSVGGQQFAAIYLLSHGVIKAVLVYALLKDKLWAFPWAIGVFAAFGVYQMYRYFIQPSGWLIALTVLDVIVIALTLAEWHRVKHKSADVVAEH